ncbi:MAG: hypothetical protein N3E38_02605 [Candidatus Aenigmarchaeota archaeon]|nr:hypothetical protein [Candidatus Aenigmarchaeota archaeon]MCX8179601.1 hypothetical protein [Candidatus Aenigmarchaeota archaeon]
MKKFEKNEIIDILVSILALSLFFTFPEWGPKYFLYLSIILVSFTLKIILNKLMARKLQCMCTYKMRPKLIIIGLFIMLLKPALGISFMVAGSIEIAPYTFGRSGLKLVKLTPYDLGIISLAGIFVNLLIAYTFIFVESELAKLIVTINSLIAVFHLLPLPPLDGSKIFMWTIWGWLFIFLLSILPLVLV